MFSLTVPKLKLSAEHETRVKKNVFARNKNNNEKQYLRTNIITQ